MQNSLPHFAGPVALTALLVAGWDPLQPKIFRAVEGIVATQQANGLWELPKNPLRPSIWATWPFIAALSNFRDVVMPTQDSNVNLIFPGCAIVQTAESHRPLTRRILVRNSIFDWLGSHKFSVFLWLIAFASALIPAVLLKIGRLSTDNFVLSLVLPVLLLTFQLLWDLRRRSSH